MYIIYNASIRNKNLVKLNNKTILEWAIISCKKTKLFSKIIVSTDSQKYLKLAKKYGADIVLLRPKKISSDTFNFFFLFSTSSPS